MGLGTVLGLLAGYFRGWTDTVIRTFADVVMTIPFFETVSAESVCCARSVGATSVVADAMTRATRVVDIAKIDERMNGLELNVV